MCVQHLAKDVANECSALRFRSLALDFRQITCTHVEGVGAAFRLLDLRPDFQLSECPFSGANSLIASWFVAREMVQSLPIGIMYQCLLPPVATGELAGSQKK